MASFITQTPAFILHDYGVAVISDCGVNEEFLFRKGMKVAICSPNATEERIVDIKSIEYALKEGGQEFYSLVFNTSDICHDDIPEGSVVRLI